MNGKPGVALLRGEALNPYEMQVYGSLADDFDLLAIGRHRPIHEVDRIQIPTVLLHAAGERRLLAAAQRRLSRLGVALPDPDRLLGLSRQTAGRALLHAAETVLPVSEQAAEIAARSGQKVVLTCWETIPFRYDEDPKLAARKAKVKTATSRFLAVTERAKDALVAEGVAESKIRVIPAAIDTGRFTPADPVPSVRAGWRVTPETPVVLFVGRLIQEKGVVELLRAFASVEEQTSVLVLIGGGNQHDRLMRAAQASGIADRVRVLPGVSHGALPEVYASADIVVAPSLTTPYWEEQFGMVLGEAMSCGRALVSTRSGAIPEVVGDAARLVEPYDVAQLAGVLDELLGDADLRKAMGAAGRRLVESRYALSRVAPKIAAAYTEVLFE